MKILFAALLLSLAFAANAQTFNYGLCYINAAEYERVYVQVHGDIYKQPLLVCYWTQAQTQALRVQLKAKYGY